MALKYPRYSALVGRWFISSANLSQLGCFDVSVVIFAMQESVEESGVGGCGRMPVVLRSERMYKIHGRKMRRDFDWSTPTGLILSAGPLWTGATTRSPNKHGTLYCRE